jgi:hypothetical protein
VLAENVKHHIKEEESNAAKAEEISIGGRTCGDEA